MSAPRLCKYGCGREIVWNQDKSMYYESDGSPHTPARCKLLQAKPVAAAAAAKPAMKQVHAIIDLSPPQYEVLRALCEATDNTEGEYVRDYLLDIMQSHLELYFSEHAKYREMQQTLRRERTNNDQI